MLKTKTQKLVSAALMLTLGILLPLVTAHGIGIPGNIFLPMHIPVFLCGLFCGPLYGALLGLILPLLNSVLTSMPVFYPMAIVMAAELCTYGLMAGLMHKLFGGSGKLIHTYPSLLIAMIAGRVVYGIVAAILLSLNPAMQKLSVIGALVQGIPGIVVQLVLIPVIVSRVSKILTRKQTSKQEAK